MPSLATNEEREEEEPWKKKTQVNMEWVLEEQQSNDKANKTGRQQTLKSSEKNVMTEEIGNNEKKESNRMKRRKRYQWTEKERVAKKCPFSVDQER